MQRLIILYFSLALFSCTGQDKNKTLKESPQVASSKSFKKEIPTYEGGNFGIFYKLKKQKENQLRLDSLESGFDSLQIRIWYDYALFTKREVIILKLAKGEWSANHIEMTVDWDPFNITETVKTSKIKPVTPKSGWVKFLNNLMSLKIMTLPNMDAIPNLHDSWADGVTYNVEVATKTLYRFYGYHVPDKFEDKFWQAKNMTGIINLVSKEFASN